MKTGYFDAHLNEVSPAALAQHHAALLGPKAIRLVEQLYAHPNHESAHAALQDAIHERRIRGRWTVARYDAPIEYYLARCKGISEKEVEKVGGLYSPRFTSADRFLADIALRRDVRANTSEWAALPAYVDNILLTQGILALWQIALGNGVITTGNPATANAYAYFNNAQAMIGVGDSTTAAVASQTDLQAATNKAYFGMNSGYPQVSNNVLTLQGTAGSAVGNFAWNEAVVNNRNNTQSYTTGGSTLDRAVNAQGTKAAGSTWTPTLTVSLS